MYRFCGARSERNSSGVNAIRQTSFASCKLSSEPEAGAGRRARHDGLRSTLLARPRSGATSGGFADRAAAVSFRLPGSQTYATFGWTERPFGPHADSALIGADAFRRRHCAELV